MGALVHFPLKRTRQRKPPARLALTEQRVAEIKSVGFVFDTKVAGLAVRVTSAGNKAYVFQRKLRGRPVRIVLGKCSGMRLDAARAAVEQLNGQIAAGVDVVAERAKAKVKAQTDALTLARAFEQFKSVKARKASTLMSYETLWRLHVPDALKRKLVVDVTSADLEALKVRLLADRTGVRKANGLSGKPRSAGKARTAAKVIVLLAAVLKKAGRRSDNPATEVERPRPTIRTRRLSGEEITSLLKVLEDRKGDIFVDLIAVAVLTGARRGALCAMRWEDLHLSEKLWLVPADWSKNGKELAVALTDKAVEILRARKVSANSRWVWPSARSKSGHIVNPDKPLRAVLSAAGVTQVSYSPEIGQ